MIFNERDIRHEHVLQIARQMMTAARTAPKAKGVDIIEVAMITGDEIKKLSDKMIEMTEEHGKRTLRAQQHRRGHCHRIGMRHGSRYACRYPCHVLGRAGGTAFKLVERLQNGYGHSGERIVEKPVFRQKTEGVRNTESLFINTEKK